MTAPALARPRLLSAPVAGRSARRLLRHTLTLVCVLAVLAFLALAVVPRTGAYRTVTMLSGSMTPDYPVGSVLIDRPVPTSELAVGDVISYHVPFGTHEVVSHRIVDIFRDGEAYVVQTKGDANNGVDPWRARITDPTVWTARGAVPHVGTAIEKLREPMTKKLFLYIFPALLTGWLLIGLWRPARRDDPV